jgi:hypothetical protein
VIVEVTDGVLVGVIVGVDVALRMVNEALLCKRSSM